MAANASDLGSALWEAQVRRAELVEAFSDRHPEVREIDARIVILRRGLASSAEATRKTESRLQELYNTEFEKTRKLDRRILAEQHILDDIGRLNELHQVALIRLKETELNVDAISAGRAGVTLGILDPPEIPDEPLWPRMPLVVLPLAVAGLLTGLAIAWLRHVSRMGRHETALVVEPARPSIAA